MKTNDLGNLRSQKRFGHGRQPERFQRRICDRGQGQGEKENFSDYSIQFERYGEITLREWVNDKEQPTIKRTKLDKAFFDVGKAHDISVTINAGVVSVTANGITVFTAENLKRQPGVFGVRTWNELDLGVASSKVTAT